MDSADPAPHTDRETLIDKDSAAERFSYMLTQADMVFHMMQPHSISNLRGIVYDACTLWSTSLIHFVNVWLTALTLKAY